MFEILLCSYFALDRTNNFELIHTRIDDRQFVWYYFYKKYLFTPDIFRGGWVGWIENVILTFCVTNWVWTLPLI